MNINKIWGFVSCIFKRVRNPNSIYIYNRLYDIDIDSDDEIEYGKLKDVDTPTYIFAIISD